jgi:hypothetical protein
MVELFQATGGLPGGSYGTDLINFGDPLSSYYDGIDNLENYYFLVISYNISGEVIATSGYVLFTTL